MSTLAIQNTDTGFNPADTPFVQHAASRQDNAATRSRPFLPAHAIVTAAYSLALRIQSAVLPLVTWTAQGDVEHHAYTLCWLDAKCVISLQIHVSDSGLRIILAEGSSWTFCNTLCTWKAHLLVDIPAYRLVDYGKLVVFRSPRHRIDGTTIDLRTDYEAFRGRTQIAIFGGDLNRPAADLPELGEDVVTITQNNLLMAGFEAV